MDADDVAWGLLADAIDEDGQMLYETLVAVRTRLPEAGEEERQGIVERTLRALVGAGLIAVTREDGGGSRTRLGDEELDQALAGRGWRTVPPGPDGSSIWIRATPAGIQALEQEAPPDLRARRAAE